MSDIELEEFFSPHKVGVLSPCKISLLIFSQTVSVKIITDRDGKPKGFGYVEFVELEGLKDALSKSGAVRQALESLLHRLIFFIRLSHIVPFVSTSQNHVSLDI